MRVLLAGFHAGEFSPLIEGRLDLESLHRGCRLLRNFVPRSIGGAFQRSGFLHLGGTHSAITRTRLLSFSFSADVTYRIELGHKTARFWLTDRLCNTPAPSDDDDDETVVWSHAVKGTAQRSDWLAKSGVSWPDATDYMKDHPADRLFGTGAVPPAGITGVTLATGGIRWEHKVYKRVISRMQAFYIPSTGGNYRFRVVGARSFARVSINPTFNGGPGGKTTAVFAAGTHTVPITAASASTYALTAGKAYFLEFILCQNHPTPGHFEYSTNGVDWHLFPANRLCRPIATVVEDNTGGVVSTPGEPLRLSTPWAAEDVPTLQTAQANDVFWVAQQKHFPRRFVRYGLEDWKISLLPVAYPPMRDPNSNNKITLTASATTGNITLTAAGGKVFEAGDVNGYYQISHRRDLPFADMVLTANADSDDIRISGGWEVFTTGKWTGTLKLWQRRKGVSGQKDLLRTWKSVEDFNVQSAGEVDGEQVLFLEYVGTGSGSADPRATLSALDATINGLVKVTQFVNRQSVKAKVIRALHSTAATIQWSEGAWSTRRGFPRAVTLHERRLLFAGNTAEPQKVWASALDAFDNFERTTLEDSAYAFQIAAAESNPILSLVSQEGLLILTAGDEWICDGGDSPSMSASHLRAKRRSGVGSVSVQPLLVGSAVLFVQRGARVLNEYIFDFQQAGFSALDLMELAEHLGAERITQMAYAQNPHSVLWVVTEKGSLLSLTYNRNQKVIAWAKHTTPLGEFESVATSLGANGIDEVWVVLRREINGVVSRSIEKMDVEHWDKLNTGSRVGLVLADGAVHRVQAEPFSEVTGIGHLEGTEVGILADGGILPPQRVIGGRVVLDAPATDCVVGLPVVAELQPMASDLVFQTGSSMGRKVAVREVDVKLWQSGACQYGATRDGDFFDVDFRDVVDPTGAAPPLFTGQRKLAMPGAFLDSAQLTLKNSSMLPLNCLAMVQQLQVNGE